MFGLESYFFESYVLLFGCFGFLFYAELYGSVLGINPVVLHGRIFLKNLVEKIVSML